ncbi:MAG: ABC-ATPase domain-containing protein [Proteobacteria bacterium]|nr:ABC-ATPase domain-containing protein [Pseudomonadota bacterium]MBU1649286.1 ABC-ATPase domain-containing protein [Pseudomonadota bacterium]
MTTKERLRTLLKKIDGRGYKAYKELKGSYQFNGYQFTVDHVQGDPFAQPSRISIHVPSSATPLPSELCSGKIRKTAAEDFLARAVARAIQAHVKGHRGIGKSGEIRIETSGQQILVRNSVQSETGARPPNTPGWSRSRRSWRLTTTSTARIPMKSK